MNNRKSLRYLSMRKNILLTAFQLFFHAFGVCGQIITSNATPTTTLFPATAASTTIAPPSPTSSFPTAPSSCPGISHFNITLNDGGQSIPAGTALKANITWQTDISACLSDRGSELILKLIPLPMLIPIGSFNPCKNNSQVVQLDQNVTSALRVGSQLQFCFFQNLSLTQNCQECAPPLTIALEVSTTSTTLSTSPPSVRIDSSPTTASTSLLSTSSDIAEAPFNFGTEWPVIVGFFLGLGAFSILAATLITFVVLPARFRRMMQNITSPETGPLPQPEPEPKPKPKARARPPLPYHVMPEVRASSAYSFPQSYTPSRGGSVEEDEWTWEG